MSELISRALNLFDEWIDLPWAERQSALAELARRDPALHQAVRALFQADDDGESGILARSPAELIASKQPAQAAASDDVREADARIGTRLGAWRIDRAVAHGGMGSVYEAHRDDGHYQQRVALKCVRAELATPELLAAFRNERNHLARLDHPGIAALVDGGVDESGQPWFAMRYVDGIAIDQWCDQRRASVRERVDLLMQAAQALGYAHAQGLLHRDIKPSNLLVTADGRVQLVDFGLSSTFEALTGAHSERIALTLDYAAPEIRRAGAHSRGAGGTAADIYALGVLSYRLLCGQWPSALHTLSALIPDAAQDAATPMERLLVQAPRSVASERGAAGIAALTRELAGDLSAIALKAVAERPQDRYPSAQEFADDLRRWRTHHPVQAHPIGWWPRTRKLLRRNRGAAVLGAALLLALGTALGLTHWQRQRALHEAQAAYAVSNLFASTLGTATLSGMGSTPFSSRNLLTKTETELRKLDLRRHPVLRAHSLATLARSYAVIGDYRHAERLADEAQLSLGDEVDEEDYVAATRLSLLNLQSRYAEAEQVARARLSALVDRHDAQAHRSKVAFGVELAQAQWGLGDPSAALGSLDAALRQARALGRGQEELLAQLLIQRSKFRARLFRLKEAQADAEQAIALVDLRNPVLADDARDYLLTMSARYRRSSDLVMAERLLRDRRKTLGERHPKTARAWILLGYGQHVSGRKIDALKNIDAGRDLIEAAYGRDHPEYALSLLMSSTVSARESRDNVQALREALRICERRLGPRHETTLFVRRTLAARLHDLAPAILTPGDHKEAEALFEYNLRIKREARIPGPWEKLLLAHSLLLHGQAADLPKVEALLRESRAEGERYFEPKSSYRGMVDIFWITLRHQQGHRAEADRDFARTLDAYRDDTSYLAQLYLHDSWMYRALYAYERCDNAQAQRYLSQALASEQARLGPTHFATRDTQGFLAALRRHGRLINTTGAQVPIKAALVAAEPLHAQACRGETR
ncbi:serine/threonine-protein kinase [Lysobacter sp. cf310]|uniref:serine/threonine-protein kinase n=1 Tax=Lysobacter sp. cf310 TaxID=1761790 RepID=UPI0008EF4923|nr:protein kinase [Lysobacter sp. cf310]SFL32079.1 serine/threonine protein kinase [Lysobacter sp. cf310]